MIKFPKNTRNLSPSEDKYEKNTIKDIDSQNCVNSPVALKNS